MDKNQNLGGKQGTTGGNVGGTTGGTTGGNVGGVENIRRELENVNFPVTKSELKNKVGSREINLGNRQLPMREIIDRVQKDRFESKDELMREIQNVQGNLGQSGGVTGGR